MSECGGHRYMTCPDCLYAHEDVWEYDLESGESMDASCDQCGHEFVATVFHHVTWQSKSKPKARRKKVSK